jgi:tetratricopeptide (TPR) repeat protein
VEFLFSQPLPKSYVIQSIQNDKAISMEVRRQALAFVERFQEEQNPKLFDQASRKLLRQPHLASRWYRQALVQAEAACRLAPDQGSYLTTLGIAQYRLEKYRQAVDTLARSEQINAGPLPADLAFLAMAHHRLGESEKAKNCLNRLRETTKVRPQVEDEEAQVFLREAEALIEAPRAVPAPPGDG